MKTNRTDSLQRLILAAIALTSGDLLAQQPGAPVPAAVATTAPEASFSATLPFQNEAMARYPELRRAGSPFNREFLARVQRRRTVDVVFFQNTRWPVVLAGEVAADGLPSVAVSAAPQPPSANGRLLLPSGPEWRFLKVYREGRDIVVPSAVATVFGWDSKLGVRDPNDNGNCASGRSTRYNPGLLGCALPVSIAHPSTVGSAFAKAARVPWFSPVVVTHKGKSITVQLIDNGPSAPVPRDSAPAGIDLTPAACLALGASLDDIRNNRLSFTVSFRLPGAAL